LPRSAVHGGMRTILVLADHPDTAEAIRAALNPEQYRIVHRTSLEESEPLLAHGRVHLCVLDTDLTGVQALWLVERARRQAPKCPLVVLAGARQAEWEEEAYLQGVAQVISKPLRPRLVQAIVDRLVGRTVTTEPASNGGTSARPPAKSSTGTDFFTLPGARSGEMAPETPAVGPARSGFEVLRKFSAILTHSLDAEGLLRQFLLLLRDLVSINRAVIFLRQPVVLTAAARSAEEGRSLRPVCWLSVSASVLEHVELSLEAGLGAALQQVGRILRRSSPELLQDPEAQKEFELLGMQVAVPIMDREQLLGVALFDGHITGEPLANPELELVFHLLEQVGLALRNIWLHDQLVANHQMLAEILRELSSACVVVGPDLSILHANKAARRLFRSTSRRTGEPEFSDLPAALGSKVYQVLKTGAGLPTFRYTPEDAPGTVFMVSIVPFRSGTLGGGMASALLIADDRTQAERLQKLELETAHLRLIRTMADRLVHEIGNALVPLATHQQLLAERFEDAEFRQSLDQALATGVQRINRLLQQMRFLAGEAVGGAGEPVPLGPLIQEAFQEAQRHLPQSRARLQYQDLGKPVFVQGDRAALRHALTEVLLNALQSSPEEATVAVRLMSQANGTGHPSLLIEIRDSGSGFTPETAQKAVEPFFTTRNVGLGLGLAVTRRIVEGHRGRLELVPAGEERSGVVRIVLPLADITAPGS
jgi:signal transduction histidine kinase/CheY-like chemotaxis protein